MNDLILSSDYHKEFFGRCDMCGAKNKSKHTVYLSGEKKSDILIGGDDVYGARCDECKYI